MLLAILTSRAGPGVRGAVITILFTCLIPLSLAAQVVALQGGTSTQLQTSGAEADYQWNNVSGFLSLGYAGGFHLGALARTSVNGYHLTAGDTQQSFDLDSDLFERGVQGFSSRGVGVSKANETMSYSVFAGTTALQRYYAFYRTFEPDLPTGAAFIDWKITDRLTVRSNTVVQDKLTTLQSLRFDLSKHWSLVGAAGVGRNQHYYSAGTDIENSRIHLTASYTGLGPQFERFAGINAVFPERKGLNLRISFHPLKKWMVYATHENFSSRSLDPQAPLRDAGLNSVGANGSFVGVQLNASATRSRSGEMWTNTGSFSLSRELLNRFLRATGIVSQVNNQFGRNRFYLATIEERVSSRLSLRETYTHSGQQHTLTAGGQFLSNRITLGIDQQLVYNTLAGNGRSMFHAWTVNLKLPLMRGMRLNLNSVIDPTGRVRYTAFLDGLFFARDGSYIPGMDPSVAAVNLGGYMVRGIVQDEAGNPVWGIAVQVDGQLAFSDTTGQFYLRFARRGIFPVAVRTDQSIAPLPYAGLRVPVAVEAQDVNHAAPVVIVVRRVTRSPEPPPTR